jgi:hypothetical protein
MNMDRYALRDTRSDLLDTTHIRPGDLLLFRGSDRVSRAIRDLDGGRFDHCAVVVDVTGPQPQLVDQNFRGFTRWSLGNYEARPEAVLIRRHRIGGFGDLFVQRALEYGEKFPHYAFDRLANIMLVSLVRSLPNIEQFSPESKARFASRMGGIFAVALSQLERGDTGVCVGLPMYVFDVSPELPSGRPGPYCGLHLEPENLGGFGNWSDAVRRFCELMIEHAPDDGGPHPLEQLRVLITRQVGRGLGSAAERPITRERAAVDVDDIASTIAIGLLDRLLRDRFVITPRDMEATRSLFDVGLLDLDCVNWESRLAAA